MSKTPGVAPDTTDVDVTLATDAVTSTDGLAVRVRLNPSSLQPGESLLATVSITNPSAQVVERVSSCSALALLEAYFQGESVDPEGAFGGCFDALTPFRIAPNETLGKSYEIKALGTDGTPLEAGTYDLRIRFQVEDLPVLDDSFRIE